MLEIWDAYDENRQKQEFSLVRGQKIPKGFYHLCVDILVRNQEGATLFIRRSNKKKHYPGYWEASAGGSCFAGESSQEAAYRELEEETGLLPQSMRLISQKIFHEEHCLFDQYEAMVTDDKIRLQERETDAYFWIKAEEIPRFLENHPVFERQKSLLKRLFII